MSNYYAVDRNSEYLSHYGIKGMKWGVRKAIESGNTKAYMRHYNKALKKLAKLEKQANSGAKYARRAAALGTAAGLTGGIAFQGASGIARGILSRGIKKRDNLLANKRISNAEIAYNKYSSAADKLNKWAQEAPYAQQGKIKAFDIRSKAAADISPYNLSGPGKYSNLSDAAKKDYIDRAYAKADRIEKNSATLTKNKMLRAGAAAATAGLLGAAGYNAYRAATTKRAAAKADQWRKEIDSTFGTTYTKKKRTRS